MLVWKTHSNNSYNNIGELRVMVMLLVIGATGTVLKDLKKDCENQKSERIEAIQMTEFLSLARILRKVPKTWGDLLSLRLPWKITNEHWCETLAKSRILVMYVTIVPIVIGALGTISKGLLKGLEDLELGGRVETIQMTALLRTARILKRVLETWGDLQNSGLGCPGWLQSKIDRA